MAGVRRRFVDEVQTPRERSARVALSAHEQLVNGATASFWYRPFPVIDALAALLYLGTAYAFYAGVTDLLQHQHQHDENGDEGAGAARNSNFEFFFFLSPAASEDSAAVLEEAAASLSSATSESEARNPRCPSRPLFAPGVALSGGAGAPEGAAAGVGRFVAGAAVGVAAHWRTVLASGLVCWATVC